jgi:hypothetical protein
MTVEEAKVIHAKADIDGDGAVSLEEYLATVNSLPNAPDLESLSNRDSD